MRLSKTKGGENGEIYSHFLTQEEPVVGDDVSLRAAYHGFLMPPVTLPTST